MRGRRARLPAARLPRRPRRRTAALDAWRRARPRSASLELVGKTALLVVLVTAAALVARRPARLARHAHRPARPALLGRHGRAPARDPELRRGARPARGVRPARASSSRSSRGRSASSACPRSTGFAGAVLALTISPRTRTSTCSRRPRSATSIPRSRRPRGAWAARGRRRSAASRCRVLRPSLGAGALLVALYTLSDFGAVSLMQYNSLTRAIFLQYRSLFDRTPAAVLALVLVAPDRVVLVLELRDAGAARYHRPSPGDRAARTACPPRPLALAGARLLRRRRRLRALPPARRASATGSSGPSRSGVDARRRAGARRSARCSSRRSPPASPSPRRSPWPCWRSRYRSGWTRALERLSYSVERPARDRDRPLARLLRGELRGLRLPDARAPRLRLRRPLLRAGGGRAPTRPLLRVDPHLEEAARGLGKSPRRAFATVTAPLVAPGLLAGAALVFLSTMKELPATLLLAPIGFETLATEVWTATTVAAYSEAAFRRSCSCSSRRPSSTC